MEPAFIEFFSGSGTLSKEFKNNGWFVESVDIRKRKGICEPTIRKSILDLTTKDLSRFSYEVIWASVPCDVWSYASGDFHWTKDGFPKTQKCIEHINILFRTLSLIDELTPGYFFIENPRGRLRTFPPFIEWLKKHAAVNKYITLSSYGFPSTKPTNIFTNAIDIELLDPDPFGRGAKTKVPGTFNKMTKTQRQKTPQLLAEKIFQFCSNKYKVNLTGTL